MLQSEIEMNFSEFLEVHGTFPRSYEMANYRFDVVATKCAGEPMHHELRYATVELPPCPFDRAEKRIIAIAKLLTCDRVDLLPVTDPMYIKQNKWAHH